MNLDVLRMTFNFPAGDPSAIDCSMRNRENQVPIENPKHTMAMQRVMRRATRTRLKIGIQVPPVIADGSAMLRTVSCLVIYSLGAAFSVASNIRPRTPAVKVNSDECGS